MMTNEDFQKRIGQLNDDFSLFTSKKKPANKQIIANYETENGLSFSDDVKDFLLTFGALILEVKESVWTRPREFDILPTWKFGYGFFVYGLSADEQMPSWLGYREKFLETMTTGDISLGQLFFKRSGNLYRAYTNSGRITIEYDKEGNDRSVYSGNFYDFLISEVDALEKDYKEYIAEQ